MRSIWLRAFVDFSSQPMKWAAELGELGNSHAHFMGEDISTHPIPAAAPLATIARPFHGQQANYFTNLHSPHHPRYHPRMVRLSKIYTKVGDAGQTMLGDGHTVSKASPRVAAYGDVDEANSSLGVVIASIQLGRKPPLSESSSEEADAPLVAAIAQELLRIQHDLFDLGADLCVPIEPHETPASRLRITQQQIDRLEHAIDRFNEPLKPLDSFVLPGGTLLAAHLHVARTTTRRAERAVAALHLAEPEKTSPLALIYLNRLSDLLFVLARVANAKESAGPGDTLWKPGANR